MTTHFAIVMKTSFFAYKGTADHCLSLHRYCKSHTIQIRQSPVDVEPHYWQTWSKAQRTDFLSSRPIENLSHTMRKSTLCICENKGAYQRLNFCYTDSTIPFLSKSKIFQPLAIFFACTARFLSDPFGNHILGFLMTRLNCHENGYIS